MARQTISERLRASLSIKNTKPNCTIKIWQHLNGNLGVALLGYSLAVLFASTAINSSVPSTERFTNLMLANGFCLTESTVLFWSLRRARAEKIIDELIAISEVVEETSTQSQMSRITTVAHSMKVLVRSIYAALFLDEAIYVAFPLVSGERLGTVAALGDSATLHWSLYLIVSVCICLSGTAFASYVGFIIQSCLSITCLFKSISEDISESPDSKQLGRQIRRHQEVLNISRRLGILCSETNFVCLSGLVGFLVTNTCILVTGSANIGLVFVNVGTIAFIYFFCILGQSISDAFGAVGDAAYQNYWIQKDETFKKIILIVILRTRQPLQLKAGMMGALKLSTFVTAMKYWYRFLQALLKFA